MYYHIRYYVTIGLFINVWWCFKGLQAEQHPATADEGKFFFFCLKLYNTMNRAHKNRL